MADKTEIVTAWLSGEYTTYASLSRKLGVSREYIRKVVDNYLKEIEKESTTRQKDESDTARKEAHG